MTDEALRGPQSAFSRTGPHGRAVQLIARYARGGLVIELSCAHAPAAETLAAEGYSYVGVDSDKRALDDLRERGFEAHEVDLCQIGSLCDQLVGIADGRPVGALLLVDVVGKIADTDAFLSALSDAMTDLHHPALVLSVSNVATYEAGARMLTGRWSGTYSRTDGEDDLRHFTDSALTAELARHGWHQLASDDVPVDPPKSSALSDHPAFVSGTPLHELLRSVRSNSDDNADIGCFVRAYALTGASRAAPPLGRVAPFLSVLVPTDGTRLDALEETLTCLAAQTHDDLEVIVLVHAHEDNRLPHVSTLVGRFAPDFRDRVRVVQVVGGGSARPLNDGIDVATGRYLTVLEGALVSADWAERFADSAALEPGRVMRAASLSRWARRPAPGELSSSTIPLSKAFAEFPDRFDPVGHLRENSTPLCSVAVPRALCSHLSLDFDESLPLLYDWDFLLRAACMAGVQDVEATTSILTRWLDPDGPDDRVGDDLWALSRRMLISKLDSAPLLLPAGSTTSLAAIVESAEPFPDRARTELVSQLDAARARVREIEHHADRIVEEATSSSRRDADEARGEAERLRAEHTAVVSSDLWRVTAPIRWLLTRIRASRAR